MAQKEETCCWFSEIENKAVTNMHGIFSATT